jgi:hypothetical protein
VIVARNLLRALAAGVAAHGARSREVLLAMKAAAKGTMPETFRGEAKIRAVAKAFGLEGRDWVGPSGEDRIRIRKLPWRAPGREQTGTSASDPDLPLGLARAKPVGFKHREKPEVETHFVVMG